MKHLLLVFAITFCTVLAFCWLLIFCRRARDRSKVDGCHETGATTCCCSCAPPAADDPCPPRLPMYRP